jgi:hypothetical protein
MTPRDHNRTVGIAHALVGTLTLTGLIIAIVSEARRHPSEVLERLGWVPYVLPLPLIQLLTAYGLFFTRRWGRALALILSAVYVWVFPVGTLLGVYTFWFLLSEGGKSLYAKPNG